MLSCCTKHLSIFVIERAWDILFFFLIIYFIYGCVGSLLLRVGFSLVVASGDYSSLRCAGFSCCGAQALGVWASVVVARGLWTAGSVVVAHRLSCSAACGIFPDQGSNPCPLHWQEDS